MATLALAFQPVPEYLQDATEHRRKLARAVNQTIGGKMNVFIDATLTANAASTTITDARIGYYSVICWMPMTANASAEIGAGTIYITQANMQSGSVVITHANNAQTDRTFRFQIIG